MLNIFALVLEDEFKPDGASSSSDDAMTSGVDEDDVSDASDIAESPVKVSDIIFCTEDVMTSCACCMTLSVLE